MKDNMNIQIATLPKFYLFEQKGHSAISKNLHKFFMCQHLTNKFKCVKYFIPSQICEFQYLKLHNLLSDSVITKLAEVT